MRATILPFVIATLFASLAFGQNPGEENVDRVLHFTHNETAQDMQEVATVIRAMGDIRQASVDTEQRALTLRGTAAQIALGEWLFNQLDQTPNTAAHEYKLASDDVVRLFYLQQARTVQDLQEEVTLVRSLADIRRLFTYHAPRAAVLRGTVSQMSLAEWLFAELDKPANRPGAHEYRMAAGGDDVVRLMYLPNTRTVQDFQQLVTLVRSLSDIGRVFTYNKPRAVALRGTGEQMSLSDWLFTELDKPRLAIADARVAHEYHMPGDVDNIVRVFYLTHAPTIPRVQDIAIQVRAATSVRRIFIYDAPRAIALRGTAAQLALANQFIEERDK